MDFNFHFLSKTVVWDPLFFQSTSYELWAQHYHQLISLWGTARFQKSTAKRWKNPLKYIVISCWTHRAKPRLSLSASTACCNPQAHPHHQMILRPICPKRHDPVCFSWWIESTWVHSPKRGSLGGPRQTPGTHPAVLLVTAIKGMGTGVPQHNTLLPQGTQSFHGCKCFSDCVALKQSNNTDCKWLESAHMQGLQRVSHCRFSHPLWEQAGTISLVFPPIFRRLPFFFFYFKQFKCSWWQTSLQKQAHTVMTSLTHMETHNILITYAGQIKE